MVTPLSCGPSRRPSTKGDRRLSWFVAGSFPALAGLCLLACHRVPEPAPAAASKPPAASPAKVAESARPRSAHKHGHATLEKITLKLGTGPTAADGDKVTIAYVGRFMNAKEFVSRDSNHPVTFTLGAGKVIKGWDEGVVGMKVGGKRRLIIPANLAYGAAGKPPTIPPNAPLWYDVNLLAVNGEH